MQRGNNNDVYKRVRDFWDDWPKRWFIATREKRCKGKMVTWASWWNQVQEGGVKMVPPALWWWADTGLEYMLRQALHSCAASLSSAAVSRDTETPALSCSLHHSVLDFLWPASLRFSTYCGHLKHTKGWNKKREKKGEKKNEQSILNLQHMEIQIEETAITSNCIANQCGITALIQRMNSTWFVLPGFRNKLRFRLVPNK